MNSQSPHRNYKSLHRNYKSLHRNYKSPHRNYKSLHRNSRAQELQLHIRAQHLSGVPFSSLQCFDYSFRHVLVVASLLHKETRLHRPTAVSSSSITGEQQQHYRRAAAALQASSSSSTCEQQEYMRAAGVQASSSRSTGEQQQYMQAAVLEGVEAVCSSARELFTDRFSNRSNARDESDWHKICTWAVHRLPL